MTDQALTKCVSVALQQEAANGRASYWDMAESAIAAARPYIRSELFAELIAEDADASYVLMKRGHAMSLEAYLRARKDHDDAQ